MFQNFDLGPSFGFMKSITIDFKTHLKFPVVYFHIKSNLGLKLKI